MKKTDNRFFEEYTDILLFYTPYELDTDNLPIYGLSVLVECLTKKEMFDFDEGSALQNFKLLMNSW
jgi:hypothetical protein